MAAGSAALSTLGGRTGPAGSAGFEVRLGSEGLVVFAASSSELQLQAPNPIKKEKTMSVSTTLGGDQNPR